MNRRELMIGGLATLAIGSQTNLAAAAAASSAASAYFAGTAVDNGVTYRTTNFNKINKKWHKQVVKYKSSEQPGTVVVDTRHHFLYLIMENQTAIRYGVGVGREGFQWFGRATIDRKALWPKWTPPPEMIARPLYLYRDGSDLGYRLHGTLEPWSIGTDASSGCIRMFNEHVIDLYQRCPIGTASEVLPHIADQAPKG
jgi:lipoprotein-anchoring transpeptidase ErfK/SrfK